MQQNIVFNTDKFNLSEENEEIFSIIQKILEPEPAIECVDDED